MNNPVGKHVYEIITCRRKGRNNGDEIARAIAHQLVCHALDGDVLAIKVMIDMLESYDPALASLGEEE